MEKRLVLQERDIELLEFLAEYLAEYKTITLDNTRYIYGTKTYQEKRICHLVKENYLTRLQHREIALGRKGKDFFDWSWCRNPNDIDRIVYHKKKLLFNDSHLYLITNLIKGLSEIMIKSELVCLMIYLKDMILSILMIGIWIF